MDRTELTCDEMAGGRLAIWQREEGYRFGLDAVLLATDLPEVPAGGRVVELGAAHGLVSLALAVRRSDVSVLAVERQSSLVELLERNVEENGLEERVEVVEGDVRAYRDLLEPHSADLVLCNPPYYRQGERRTSDDPERAAARHELEGELADFVEAAQYVLDQRGWFKLIVPPVRLGDLYSAVGETDLSFDWLRFFHSRDEEDAYLVEALLRRGGAADVRIRPPLVVYDGADYGPEVEKRLAELA